MPDADIQAILAKLEQIHDLHLLTLDAVGKLVEAQAYPYQLQRIISDIRKKTAALKSAEQHAPKPIKEIEAMSAPSIIGQLQAAVAAEDSVVDSAIVLINGIAAQIAAGIAAALAGGATAAQLQPLNATLADITAKTSDLAAAVQANTPTPPPVGP